MTVRNGDITLFLDVDDFTIEVHDPEDEIYTDYSWSPIRLKSGLPNYTIRSSTIPLDEEGIAFKMVKAGKPVTRTVSIEIEEWTVAQINEAQKATGAPPDAVPNYLRQDGKHHVEFKWEEQV